jgi:hypothetical protein
MKASDAQRLRLGVVTATVVLIIGVAKVANVDWAIVVAMGAAVLVAAAVYLGNRIGAKRSE